MKNNKAGFPLGEIIKEFVSNWYEFGEKNLPSEN